MVKFLSLNDISLIKITYYRHCLLLPWNEKRLFREVKHGRDVISVNYPHKDFHGTFIARTNTISVEYHGDNPFPMN
jgi:hypothetical protein